MENTATAVVFEKPGVMALRSVGLEDPALAAAASGRPFLGICVGMQLMASRGLEHGETSRFSTETAGLLTPGSPGSARLPDCSTPKDRGRQWPCLPTVWAVTRAVRPRSQWRGPRRIHTGFPIHTVVTVPRPNLRPRTVPVNFRSATPAAVYFPAPSGWSNQ